MRATYSLVAAAGLLLLGWLLPMITNDLPNWLKWTLFVAAAVFAVFGTVKMAREAKPESRVGDIDVKMGGGNSIRNIGHTLNEQRKEDR
jgi:hypothetical protein